MVRTLTNRVRTNSPQLTSCIGSLLALELLHPSDTLYLVAPMIRNTALLPTSLGQFSSLAQDDTTLAISLASILSQLTDLGTNVYLIHQTSDVTSEEFLITLPDSIHRRHIDNPLPLGLFSEHFSIRGWLNFTEVGISMKDQVEISLEQSEISKSLLQVRSLWEDGR